jgi:hypothetical protein
VRVDLGAAYNVKRVKLDWEGAYAKDYKVQVSDDANNWSDLYTTTSGAGGKVDLAGLSGRGRYVRVLCTAPGANGNVNYSLWGLEVFGGVNLARGRQATASTVSGGGDYAAANAFDGNHATRWSSGPQTPASIHADLGSSYAVGAVRLYWEGAAAREYKIEVSDNASDWSTVYHTASSDGGYDDLTGLAGAGRYVRVLSLAPLVGNVNYSLWEFEVYGA